VGPREKTQTAVQSPLSSPGLPETAVVLLVGSADSPGLPAARRLVIAREELEIGRSPSDAADARGAAVVLPDPLVSGLHARLGRAADGTFELTDLGSKNGTFVDGVRVDGRARLRSGAVIFLGNHVAIFRMVSTRELDALKAELVSPLAPVATTSPVLAMACDRLRRLAAVDGELLLLGETGVGKEIYARAVHERTGRHGRFVAINCGAIPRDLVESELFGYRQGAHSTALGAKTGLIEEAEGGTLFLDELGEMAEEAQIKLLRFLQDRELTPLGSTRPRKMDVRIIAATNRTTSSGNSPGGLREDILGRLGAAPIHLPPLRDRIEDVGALCAHFLRNSPVKTFDQPAFRALILAPWPLNVRELEKSVTTAAVLAAGRTAISLHDLPDSVARPASPFLPSPAPSSSRSPSRAAARRPPVGGGGDGGPTSTSPSTATPTRAEIEALLLRYNGNVADVSRELGKHRAAIWRWMKKWGIGVEKFRRPD
jgi:transcriptional regulator with PAS, ATPase and Fis domain